MALAMTCDFLNVDIFTSWCPQNTAVSRTKENRNFQILSLICLQIVKEFKYCYQPVSFPNPASYSLRSVLVAKFNNIITET
jgi:hypothetical protein